LARNVCLFNQAALFLVVEAGCLKKA
jgi:hypothetical protein